MGNCFTCLRTDSSATNISMSDTVKEKVANSECRLETDDLLPTETGIKHNQIESFPSSKFGLNGKVVWESQSAKESQMFDNSINKLFEEYKDVDSDAILSDGIERLCADLKYSPDDFPILVLAFALEANTMCCFTKQEFIHGLKKINATSIDELRGRLIEIIDELKTNTEIYKQLYRFTFNFGLEEGARILSLDMAISLWKLVYTIHLPPKNILERWLNFLKKENIRGIQRDTWLMFLNFSEIFDLNSYDSDEAWPSLFDDFVEYERERLKNSDNDDEDDTNNNHLNMQQQH